jgi:two-component system NtrC family sensor kinase
VSRKEIGEMLKDIKGGTDRITAIVNGLKDFSRNNPSDEKMPYNLNDGIRSTLLIANGELSSTGAVDFQEGDIPVFLAYGGQINQVLLNILINASHAVRGLHGSRKGRITVSTYTHGDCICCRISDNGHGMSDEVKRRLFEPFFTTKKVGQGTGLGMSISYDIVVNKHGGRIDVESEEGAGSVFSICFPMVPA